MSTPEDVRLREKAAARCTAKIKRKVLKKQARKARAEHLVKCSLELVKRKDNKKTQIRPLHKHSRNAYYRAAERGRQIDRYWPDHHCTEVTGIQERHRRDDGIVETTCHFRGQVHHYCETAEGYWSETRIDFRDKILVIQTCVTNTCRFDTCQESVEMFERNT